MDKTQLILSIVSTIIGVLGGAAGGNAMVKRKGGTSLDSIMEGVYAELDDLNATVDNELRRRVLQIENELKKLTSKPAPRSASKPVAKKPAPAAKKATPKKK